MTKEKICGNCEHYRVGRGKYGTGICVSDKSLRKNKNCILKNDTCKYWERRTNESDYKK